MSGIALVLLLAASATAAGPPYLSIEAVRPVPGSPQHPARQWTIYLDGQFDAGAPARLAELIAQQGIAAAAVYLNSPGGGLIPAMAIGHLLREHRFHTQVGRRVPGSQGPAPGVCYSACPFAYAGGVGRRLEQGSVIGIHRVTNRVAVPDEAAFEQVVAGQALEYLAAMGIDSQLFPMMASISPDGIRLLTRHELLRLHLVNDGDAEPGSTGMNRDK